MLRYGALLALGVMSVWGVVVVVMAIGSVFTRRSKRKAIHAEIDSALRQRDNVWKEVANVQDVVKLYMNMVAKHGPESDEAHAFRFGTGSPLMKELHGDNEAMQAFEQQADIIDQTYCKVSKLKK